MTPTLAIEPLTADRAAREARRRWLRAVGALLASGAAPSARAHHGFIGRYDFDRPLYLSGRVTRVYAGPPHARLTILVPASVRLPRDRERMRPLEDAEARQTLTLLALVERRGQLEIVLDRVLTRRLVDEPDLVKVGEPVEAVAYRRISLDEYRHELMGVLLLLPNSTVLVGSSTAVARQRATDPAPSARPAGISPLPAAPPRSRG